MNVTNKQKELYILPYQWKKHTHILQFCVEIDETTSAITKNR